MLFLLPTFYYIRQTGYENQVQSIKRYKQTISRYKLFAGVLEGPSPMMPVICLPQSPHALKEIGKPPALVRPAEAGS